MACKQWFVNEGNKNIARAMAEEYDLDPFLVLLLMGRGIEDPMEIEEFLGQDGLLADPMEFAGMREAVNRIQRAMDEFERIAIYGDYDADGVTATALLYSYLSEKGANVLYYIPDRLEEGYGMSLDSVRILHEQEVNLIITVDNGIRSVEEVALAKELGMDVVVTDHHLPHTTLPQATAVIDPHLAGQEGFSDYAGVGVAFFLICGLEGCTAEELLEEYGDLVALGTVADLMPLLGENRRLVQAGLEKIQQDSREGVRALLECAGLGEKPITAGNLAFQLAPRLNAAGRIGSPKRSVALLLEEDFSVAMEIAMELNEENTRRRELEEEIVTRALALVEENPSLAMEPVLIVRGTGFHPGVIGIAASRLAERFGRPAVVMTDNGTHCVGSARSISGVSIYDILQGGKDFYIRFGGHHQAAGMSISSEDYEVFYQAVMRQAETLYPVMPLPSLRLDCKLNPASLSLSIFESVKQLEPFGCGNPTPIFGLFGMKLEGIYPIGGGQHQKLMLSRNGVRVPVLKFRTQAQELTCQVGDVIDVAVSLDSREYNGTQNLSVIMKDWRIAGGDEQFCEEKRRYERYRTHGEAVAALSPDRDTVGQVYRYIRQCRSVTLDDSVLAYRTGVPYGKARVSLDALAELQLIELIEQNERLQILYKEPTGKVRLEDSKILQSFQTKEGEK